uniref:Secreted protein n=1 Tax=Syphacia muris TaxID=451379 RepID=A0A0N5ASP8_9BILA
MLYTAAARCSRLTESLCTMHTAIQAQSICVSPQPYARRRPSECQPCRVTAAAAALTLLSKIFGHSVQDHVAA